MDLDIYNNINFSLWSRRHF